MKPVFQTITTHPHGNCLQACVASILELELDQVPNFSEAVNWHWALVQFLEGFGLFPLFLDRKQSEPGGAHGCEGGWWSVVTGQSPRGDYLHAMVAFNGKIKHDPYPEGDCKIGALEDEIVFVVKDPSILDPAWGKLKTLLDAESGNA